MAHPPQVTPILWQADPGLSSRSACLAEGDFRMDQLHEPERPPGLRL